MPEVSTRDVLSDLVSFVLIGAVTLICWAKLKSGRASPSGCGSVDRAPAHNEESQFDSDQGHVIRL